ncbi:MAG: 3'-5' exonuclease [Pseudomonadales bacterium]|nr:3'-5' exonuclease [Pseudomonadales bacterium]
MAHRTVTLDSETTGLDPARDELLEIAIVDHNGATLFNSLIKPSPANPIWPEAEAIHGITPEMVANAPALSEISTQIEAAVSGKDVIIYNSDFDAAFLGPLLSSANSIKCCMEHWAEHIGEWSEYHGSYRWHKLIDAAEYVHFEWPGDAHRALADSLACRAVWQYMNDQGERERVDNIRQDKQLELLALMELNQLELNEEARQVKRSKTMERFINHWWLGLYGPSHWAHKDRYRQGIEEEFAVIFFGKTLESLELEAKFEVTYQNQKLIPAHLKPASYFRRETWYQAELIPCAAYIGKKRSWPLYDVSEKDRIQDIYKLRLAHPKLGENEILLTKTKLKKAGLSGDEIAVLEPVAERQNPNSFDWYYLYKFDSTKLPNPSVVG